jgi:hypothetical protein
MPMTPTGFVNAVSPNEVVQKIWNEYVQTITVANKTAITSTTGQMLGAAVSVTPRNSSRLHVTFDGAVANSAAAAGQVIPSFGTGTAPVNSAAFSGTQVGNGASMTSIAATVAAAFPFSTSVVMTGLTIGTKYWLDLDCLVASGTITITNLNVTVVEI